MYSPAHTFSFKRPPLINHGSNYQQNVNPGMFYRSDRSSDNFMGNLGSIGGVQVCESPASFLEHYAREMAGMKLIKAEVQV
jgi:hypothetical protein